MKKNIIWMFIGCLMVLSLATSCETTTTEQITDDDTEDIIKITESTRNIETEEVEKGETKTSDIPQYGGTHNMALAFDITNWANGLEFC